MKNLAPLVSVITRAMRDHLAVVIGAINVRLDELERRVRAVPEKGDKGDIGPPGADGKTPEVEPIIAAVLKRIPTPKDGERGPQGPAPELEPIIAAVLQRIPPPRDGRDGTDGKDGKDGRDGQSITGPQGERGIPGESIKGEKGDDGPPGPIGPQGQRGNDAPAVNQQAIIEEVSARFERQVPSDQQLLEMVAAEVERAVAALPKPKDGIDGKNGIDGVGLVGPSGPPGPQGPPGIGERGEPGAPGRTPSPDELDSIVGKCVEREFSKFALDCERRLNEMADRTLQRAVDKVPLPKDGADGKNGRDALDLEDVDMAIDDEGFLNVALKRGDFEKQFKLYIPTVSDKGVWRQDKKYLRQNGVTHNGSFWIAQIDNPSERPGTGQQWRLAVKAGTNGRNGNDGKEGPQGPPGQDLRYK